MDFLFLFIGLAVGALVGYLIPKGKKNGDAQQDNSELEGRIHELDKENGKLEDRLQQAETFFRQQKTELDTARQKNETLNVEIGQWKSDYRNLEERLIEHKQEVDKLQKKFTLEFENVANKILKTNSREFAASNEKNLGDILQPLREKIESFERKVDETHKEELKDKASLKQELRHLVELNQKISKEAQNLTNALKGDNKTQGNWGEMILERVLERSGLTKGQEYVTQFSTQDQQDDGSLKRKQPDVIIHLPDNKHIIIDAKVSLLHYDAYVNAATEVEREAALKSHLTSLSAHIDGLSKKSYSAATELNAPDFVLLFLPIEASFSVAIQSDLSLFNYAWDRKIVIVSPTTLLATLKTISSIWKHEQQTKNAIKIAEQGGRLYDKFVGFLEDFAKIEKGLDDSQLAYQNALNKLKTGNGNLINRSVKLKELGLKTKKVIPEKFMDGEETSLED